MAHCDKSKPRNTYDLPEDEHELEPYQLNELVERSDGFNEPTLDSDAIMLTRNDIDGFKIDGSIVIY